MIILRLLARRRSLLLLLGALAVAGAVGGLQSLVYRYVHQLDCDAQSARNHPGCQTQPILLLNGRISTMADPPQVEALAVRDGEIVALGTSDALKAQFPEAAKVDLNGYRAFPGFHDVRIDLLDGGLGPARLDLSAATDLQRCLELIDSALAGSPDDPWLLGSGWSEAALGGQPLNAQRLDQVATDRPIFLWRQDRRAAALSSRALDLLDITARTPDPPGGRIDRDRSGKPTGLIEGAAARDAWARLLELLPIDLLKRALLAAQSHLLANGITRVGSTQARGIETLVALGELYEAGLWRLRVELHPRLEADPFWAFSLYEALEPETLTVAAPALSIDGPLLERQAALSAPAAGTAPTAASNPAPTADGGTASTTASNPAPTADGGTAPTAVGTASTAAGGTASTAVGTPSTAASGTASTAVGIASTAAGGAASTAVGTALTVPRLEAPSIARLLQRAAPSRPLLVAHGDQALGAALDALEAAPAVDNPAVAGDVWPDAAISRMAKRGVAAVVAPLLASRWAGLKAELPEALAGSTVRFKSLVGAGLPVVVGSGWPELPVSPLLHIQWSVANLDAEGAPVMPAWHEAELVPVEQAIAAYTRLAARASGRDDREGTLEVGNLADLVVVDRDLLSRSPLEFDTTQVVMTIVGGEVVWRREGGLQFRSADTSIEAGPSWRTVLARQHFLPLLLGVALLAWPLLTVLYWMWQFRPRPRPPKVLMAREELPRRR